MAFVHKSVLLDETVSSLRVRPGGVYVDGTLGGGGHSLEIAKRMAGQGRLIGIDRDEAAIEAAGERLRDMGELVTIVRGNFDRMPSIVQALGIQRVNGIILDLGVSSYQLDTADRGFSYMQDAPLDMRMDQREKRTAGDIVNGYSEHELFRIIRAGFDHSRFHSEEGAGDRRPPCETDVSGDPDRAER